VRNGQHAARRAAENSRRHASDEHSRHEPVAMTSRRDEVGVDTRRECQELGGRIALQQTRWTIMSFGTRSCSRIRCKASPASCL
jgi:hypothetical protein